MKKNQIIEIEITDTTLEGDGVGRYDGVAVFVPATVMGDVVKAHVLKVKPNCAYAKVVEILKASSMRENQFCGSFPKCGGCIFKHIKYENELELKANSVKNAIKRIGGIDTTLEPITFGSDKGYRNKCQYPVANTQNGLLVGFFSNHSHRVVDCPECDLQPEEFSAAVKGFKKYITDCKVSVFDEASGKGLIRHLYLRKATATGEIMASVVATKDSIPDSDYLIEIFKKIFGSALKSVVLNINNAKTNVILGNRNIVLYGDGFITDILCSVKVRISPMSFYQVNHDIAEALYKKVADYAKPEGKTVVDLYCGTGTIGLSLADKAKEIIGVEIVPEAVLDAEFNATQNGFDNCRFICADAAKAAKNLKEEGIKPDVVIVDPPRKGCDAELIKTISQGFAPKTVVYVSCNPATLARDLKIFKEMGYETVKAAPFDMFPRTAHVECVVSLKRVKK